MSATATINPAAEKSCCATSTVALRLARKALSFAPLHNVSERVKMHNYKLLSNYYPLKI